MMLLTFSRRAAAEMQWRVECKRRRQNLSLERPGIPVAPE
jgi:hypothetical protein